MTGLLFPGLMDPVETFGEPGLVRQLAYAHGIDVGRAADTGTANYTKMQRSLARRGAEACRRSRIASSKQ